MRRCIIVRFGGGYMNGEAVTHKMSQQRMEQMRQHERVARTSSRFTVERRQATDLEGTFIGIDLGTTNSCMTYIDPETRMPKVIPSPSGSWVYPTAVTFDKNHSVRLCGEEARAVARTSSSATLCSGKRLIGRRYGELGRVSTQMSKTNTLHVNERGEVSVEISGRSYTVTHIVAIFLRHMKKMAEEYLQKPVDACVVSVPAYFTPQQKVATEDAALIAGFEVLEVIDEPSAACLSYSVLRDKSRQASPSGVETSLVFDLGGGTLDCALMDHHHADNTFTLVATHGDPLLGGNDWDNVLANEMGAAWERKWRIQIESNENRFGGTVEQRLLQLEAEKAKVHFSHSLDDYVGYNRSFHFSEQKRDIIPLEVKFTFEDYLRLTAPLRERCRLCVERILEESGRKPSDVHNILLVGAMTRDPPIRRDLEKFFGRMPTAVDECPPDYAVAIGAGVRAGMLQGLFPDLAKTTRFVRGTRQAMASGGMMSRAMNFVWSKMEQNPNAIGHKWRGVVKGLEDEEIERYAREIVEFEATSDRRLHLERVEGEANDAMQRVIRNNYKKQGMQEKVVKQLTDQLKFWQYMVRNFHEHEDHLARVVKELNEYMDEVEGRVADNEDSMTAGGTIDFDKLRAQREALREEQSRRMIDDDLRYREEEESDALDEVAKDRLTPGAWHKVEKQRQQQKSKRIVRTTGGKKEPVKGSEAVLGDDTDPDEGKSPEMLKDEAADALKSVLELGNLAEPFSARAASEQEAQRKLTGTKVLRREVPLPKTAHVEELIEKGGPTFIGERQLDFELSETTRQSLFRDYVQDRAWREPPAPPGESGSWLEVKAKLDGGERLGEPIRASDVKQRPQRELTSNERMLPVLEWLNDEYALELGLAEHETTRCSSIRVFDDPVVPTPAPTKALTATQLLADAAPASTTTRTAAASP